MMEAAVISISHIMDMVVRILDVGCVEVRGALSSTRRMIGLAF